MFKYGVKTTVVKFIVKTLPQNIFLHKLGLFTLSNYLSSHCLSSHYTRYYLSPIKDVNYPSHLSTDTTNLQHPPQTQSPTPPTPPTHTHSTYLIAGAGDGHSVGLGRGLRGVMTRPLRLGEPEVVVTPDVDGADDPACQAVATEFRVS